MRIAFVNHLPPFSAAASGAQRSMEHYIEGLVASGHDVTAFHTGDEVSGEHPSGVDVEPLPESPGTGLTYSQRVEKRLKADPERFQDFDVVHSYEATAIAGLVALSEHVDSVLVQTLPAYRGVCPKNDLLYLGRQSCSNRGALRCAVCAGATTPVEGPGDLVRAGKRVVAMSLDRRLIERASGRYAEVDCFHTYTPKMRDTYAGFGYPEDRFRIVPPIVGDRFQVSDRGGFEPPFRLLYAGRIHKQKGVDRLVPMMEGLRTEGVQVQLSIAGEGPLSDIIASDIRASSVADDIALLGKVPYEEMPETFSNHDLLVYPGRWEEPFGRVFIEALASGTPVVATNVSHVAEILGDAGVVVEGSVEGLTEGVRSVCSADRLAEMATAARAGATRYAPENVIPAMESIYRGGR